KRRLERAVANRPCDLLVRVAERHTRAYQSLRGVGCEQQRIGRGAGEPLVVELEAVDEHGERAERAGDVTPSREDGRLVLLQVAVVCERQTLDGREQPGEPADRRSGLAARELGDVGVELL